MKVAAEPIEGLTDVMDDGDFSIGRDKDGDWWVCLCGDRQFCVDREGAEGLRMLLATVVERSA